MQFQKSIYISKHFEKLFNENKSQLEDQQFYLNVGLDKIKETEQQLLGMWKSLDQKKIEFKINERQIGEKLQTIMVEKKEDNTRLSSDVEKKAQQTVITIYRLIKNQMKRQQIYKNQKQRKLKLLFVLLIHLYNSKIEGYIKINRQYEFYQQCYEHEYRNNASRRENSYQTKYLSGQEGNIDKINFASKTVGPLVMWLYSQLKDADVLQKVNHQRQEVGKLLSECDLLKNNGRFNEVTTSEAKTHNLLQKESIKSERLKVFLWQIKFFKQK